MTANTPGTNCPPEELPKGVYLWLEDYDSFSGRQYPPRWFALTRYPRDPKWQTYLDTPDWNQVGWSRNVCITPPASQVCLGLMGAKVFQEFLPPAPKGTCLHLRLEEVPLCTPQSFFIRLDAQRLDALASRVPIPESEVSGKDSTPPAVFLQMFRDDFIYLALGRWLPEGQCLCVRFVSADQSPTVH